LNKEEKQGMWKASLAAAVLVVAGIGGANAAVLKMDPTVSASNVVEVQHRYDHRHQKRPPPPKYKHKHKHQQWNPGHRYDRSPPGWRQYKARPYDWQRRGCVIVGPVWFCP
jgi:Ni/Co efflux regulator RcnB